MLDLIKQNFERYLMEVTAKEIRNRAIFALHFSFLQTWTFTDLNMLSLSKPLCTHCVHVCCHLNATIPRGRLACMCVYFCERIPLRVAHPVQKKKTRAMDRKDRKKGGRSLAEGWSSLPTYHLLFPHSIKISRGMKVKDESDMIIFLLSF